MSTLSRIRNNLARPFPELVGYLAAKVISTLWRFYLPSVGRSFHVSFGTRIQGGDRIVIGDRFIGGPYLWIEAVKQYSGSVHQSRILIGDGVTCSHFVHISATRSVTIGNGVLLGSKVHITDHSHGVYHGDNQDRPDSPPSHRRLSDGLPVVIGDNAWLGDGVVVLPGVTIGAGAIIGANSVVTRDISPGVMAVGAPAKPIKRFDSKTSGWILIN